MEPHVWLKKLQLLIDEQSPMRIKPDSLIFLGEVKNCKKTTYSWTADRCCENGTQTRHMFHSEIGAQSVLRVVWWTRQQIHCRNSRQTICLFEQWQRAKLGHVSHSWKRAVEEWSASCALGQEAKRTWRRKSCDILKLTVSSIQWSFNETKRWVSLTCVEKLPANETREQCYDLRQRDKSSEQRVCRSSARTHTGTRTMPPDTSWDEHWHTAFSNFTCRSILQFVSLDLFSQDSQCDPTAEHHSNICSELHMYHLCAMFGESVFALIPDHEVRAAKLTNRWISGCWWGTRRIVRRTPGGDENMVCLSTDSVRRKLTWRAMESTWNDRSSRDEVEFLRGNGFRNTWTNSGTTSRRGNADSNGIDGNSHSTSTCTSAWRIHTWNSSSQQQRRRRCGGQDEDGDLWLILRRSYENEGDWQGRPLHKHSWSTYSKAAEQGRQIDRYWSDHHHTEVTGTQERHQRGRWYRGDNVSLPGTGTSLLWAPSWWQL